DDPQRQAKGQEKLKKINEAYQNLKSYTPVLPQPEVDQDVDATTYYQWGMELAKDCQYQQAIDYFSKAIWLDVDLVKAYKYRGLAYSQLGEHRQAIADFNQAASLYWQYQDLRDYQDVLFCISKLQHVVLQPLQQNWRCVHTLKGHTYFVYAVAISPDRETIVSGSTDGTIKLWDVQTGKEKQTLKGHAGRFGYVQSIAISPDGKLLVSGGNDKTIKLWQLSSGKERRTLTGHSGLFAGVKSVTISPDGKLLASGSDDKTIKLWSLAKGRELRTFKGHTAGVNGVAISPDGKILASGSSDKTIKLWQVGKARELHTLTGHTDSVNGIAFSSDGQIFASGSADGTIKLWQLSSGRILRTLKGHHDRVNAVAFSP
ncbi:MAG: hypothetical protein RLP02_06440, partial [Coleofasciculus sp. C2-GNP5-27]